jgi:hypothetical protein
MPVPELEALLDAELLLALVELALVLVLLVVVLLVVVLLVVVVSDPPVPDALLLEEPPVPPLPLLQPPSGLAKPAARTVANPKIILNLMMPLIPVCAAHSGSASSTSGPAILCRWIPSLIHKPDPQA